MAEKKPTAGSFVTDDNGRHGVLVGYDKDAEGTELPVVAWLPQAGVTASSLKPLG